MTLRDFLLFSGVAAGFAVPAHEFVRRFWIAALGSTVVASLINVGHEAYLHHATIRPGDIMFLPFVLILGIIAAFPAAVLAGIPFYVVRLIIRRRRQPNAA